MPTLDLDTKSLQLVDKKHQLKAKAPNLPHYDAGLIDALEHEHEELLALFTKVLHVAKNNEFSKLKLSLVELATSFTTHIKIEDEKLYGYLKLLASKKSKVEQRVVAEFADEMKGISTSIFDIISQITDGPIDADNIDNFILEFEQIGRLLTDRIEREEQVLYPIYKNSPKSGMTS